MAELVDALDLGSSAFGRGGSSPPLSTSVMSRDIVPVLRGVFLFFGAGVSRVIVPLGVGRWCWG